MATSHQVALEPNCPLVSINKGMLISDDFSMNNVNSAKQSKLLDLKVGSLNYDYQINDNSEVLSGTVRPEPAYKSSFPKWFLPVIKAPFTLMNSPCFPARLGGGLDLVPKVKTF